MVRQDLDGTLGTVQLVRCLSRTFCQLGTESDMVLGSVLQHRTDLSVGVDYME